MTVLTEFPESPARTAETLGIWDIQIFTASQCVSAQAGLRQKRHFLGNSGGKRPSEFAGSGAAPQSRITNRTHRYTTNSTSFGRG